PSPDSTTTAKLGQSFATFNSCDLMPFLAQSLRSRPPARSRHFSLASFVLHGSQMTTRPLSTQTSPMVRHSVVLMSLISATPQKSHIAAPPLQSRKSLCRQSTYPTPGCP